MGFRDLGSPGFHLSCEKRQELVQLQGERILEAVRPWHVSATSNTVDDTNPALP